MTRHYAEGEGFTGAISLGYAPDGRRKRLKRKGGTKAEVKDKLIEAVKDLESGIRSPENYTVKNAVGEWLSKGLRGRDPGTVTTNRILAEKHVIPLIGKRKLRDLRADEVEEWLDKLTGTLSTSSLYKVHAILKRSIRQAQARDLVMRNVAELVTTPKGTAGRPSRALTFDQAMAVLEKAKTSRLNAYFVLSLMTGIRTEEARELRWDHVVAWVDDETGWRPVTKVGFDHKRFAVYIWRSVRATGDTKTKKSRRTLELPRQVADALRKHHARQAEDKLRAGGAWQDQGLPASAQAGDHQGRRDHEHHLRVERVHSQSPAVRQVRVRLAPRLAPTGQHDRKRVPE